MRGLHIHEIRRARELRHEQTAAEERLWRCLRGRKLKGFKFVRQAPLGPYFGDFVCRERKLVIELDGATHGTEAEIQRDQKRSAYLANQGYRVIRFTNTEVFETADDVIETVLAALGQRATL
jgi:very-short-patch-repair endonuclease